jgi:hypothetical protein
LPIVAEIAPISPAHQCHGERGRPLAGPDFNTMPAFSYSLDPRQTLAKGRNPNQFGHPSELR